MLIVIAIWLALAGGLAALAGLAGMRRIRRLRRDGLTAWAVAVPAPVPPDESPSGSSGRVHIQYMLADGRVIDRLAPAQSRKTVSLQPGQKVLVWYDPKDPDDVLVYGQWGRTGDRVFVAAGALFVLVGAGIAILSH